MGTSTAQFKLRKPAQPRREARPLLTPIQAAKLLGLDQVAINPRAVILGMARRGELVAVRVGRWTMIDPDSVDDFIERGK